MPPERIADAGAGAVKFTPEWQDSLLVGKMRETALEAIRMQGLVPRGRRVAWNACRAFAATAVPLGSRTFLEGLAWCVEQAQRGRFWNYRVWVLTSLELIEQGRLGKEKIPVGSEQGLKTLGVREMQ